MSDEKRLTTSSGIPVGDDEHTLTAGDRGPVLVQDFYLTEKLAHFNRERIPERIVHAKGAGAHGYFEVTADISKHTKAKFLSAVGKRTPIFARFSTVGGEKGSDDTERDPRGFAVKFYTEDGNYDLVGNNTPVFFINDPSKFPDFIHTQKRNPQTNLKDPFAFWDFLSLHPESLHQVTILFSDRGVPKSYRHMHGFGSHTFKWVNAQGEAVWVKYHFRTKTGIENLNAHEATIIAGEDPDHATRDLFNHIAGGGTAEWELSVQIMPLKDAETYKWDPFDVTKVWSFKDYPRVVVGRMVLDRNPENYFAEVEQAAFAPSNIVPGIEFSPDKLLQGRIFAYPDAHRYSLGPNFAQIPVNCPYAAKAQTYQRDGLMTVNDNGGKEPNYYPNSFDGPRPATEYSEKAFDVEGRIGRTPYRYKADNYTQAGDLYRVMPPDAKQCLIDNIVKHMKQMSPLNESIANRQIAQFFKADPEYGKAIAEGLGLPIDAIKKNAALLV